MKQTVLQCITALVCVVAICVTGSLSMGKISGAKLDAAKKAAETAGQQAGQLADPNEDNNSAAPDGSAAADDVTEPDGSATPDDATTPDDPSATDKTDANSDGKEPSKKPSETSKVPSGKAAIAAYYNNAINKAVSAKAGFTKKRVTTTSNLNGGPLLKIQLVVDTVNDFLGVGTTDYTYKKGDAKNVPEISKASLAAGDLTAANCTASGDIYTITMTLVNGSSSASASGTKDSSPMGKTGLYAGKGDKKAYDYKNAANIHEGLNNAEGASVEAVAETTANAKITAKINAKTGNLVSVNISYNWSVKLTKIKYEVIPLKEASGDAVTTATFSNFVF